MRKRASLIAIFIALFLSGFAALVYQATWGRLLQRVFGVGDLAIATVLASFFLGLGLGSVLGGRWGQKVHRPAILYGLFELAIGLYAFLSIWFIPRVHFLYAMLGTEISFEILTFIRLILALALLLPPTILMGSTLPLLIAVLAKKGEDWTSSATWLYATNTLGAVLGAGATGFWLISNYGTRLTILFAASMSLLSGVIIVIFWLKKEVGREIRVVKNDVYLKEEERDKKIYPRLAVFLAGLTGYAALSGEVIWTRVLRYIVQGTTQAFSAMLVNYLLGIALGSLLAERFVAKGKKAISVFIIAQVVLAILTIISMQISPQLLRFVGLLNSNGIIVPHETWIILVVSAILLFPIALVSGMSIPLAWSISGISSKYASRWAGRVLASNTIGGLIASIITGFVLIPEVGIEATIIIVFFVYLVTASIAARAVVQRNFFYKVLAVIGPIFFGVIIIRANPSLDVPYILSAQNSPTKAIIKGPGEEWREPILFLEEGRNTAVHVLGNKKSMRVFNDGRPESGLSSGEPGFGKVLALLGGLPSFFAKNRERALVIGLGAGNTVTTMLAGPWKRIDVVELETSVVRAARLMHKIAEKPFPLDDNRTKLYVDDARAFLVLSEEETYDAIVSQPSHPWLAGSSALYTEEFFKQAKRSLRPGGILTIWVNMFRIELRQIKNIIATLKVVFPNVNGYVVESNSLILIASEEKIKLSSRVDERMREHNFQKILEPLGFRSRHDLVKYLEIDTNASEYLSQDAEIIRDDRPMLEFELAKVPYNKSVGIIEIDGALKDVQWLSEDTLRDIETEDRVGILQIRMQTIYNRINALERVRLTAMKAEISSEEHRFLEGIYAEKTGHFERAITYFEKLKNPVALSAMNELLYNRGRYSEIVEKTSAYSIVPTNLYHVYAATLYVNKQKEMKMLQIDVREGDGDNSLVLYNVLKGYNERGCEYFFNQKNIDLTRLNDEAVFYAGMICAFESDRQDLGKTYTRYWTEANMLKSNRFLEIAKNCYNGENFGAAVEYYNVSIHYYPLNALAFSGLARTYMKLGKVEESRGVLIDALKKVKEVRSRNVIFKTSGELEIDLGQMLEEREDPFFDAGFTPIEEDNM